VVGRRLARLWGLLVGMNRSCSEPQPSGARVRWRTPTRRRLELDLCHLLHIIGVLLDPVAVNQHGPPNYVPLRSEQTIHQDLAIAHQTLFRIRIAALLFAELSYEINRFVCHRSPLALPVGPEQQPQVRQRPYATAPN
jgi:hypothetical protein